jgi:tetratricopeptide (TPR) repeat protein
MKLGVFIALAICVVSAAAAHASPSESLVEQAAARARAGNHVAAIELYRQAYEQESDPTLLVRIARELRMAGKPRDALAYFCSYLFVDAAGPLADDASQEARALSGQLGNVTDSDQKACSQGTRPAATVATHTVDMTETIPRPPPRITKREIVGLTGIGLSLTSLGLALYEARRVTDLTEQMNVKAAGTPLGVLEDRRDRASLHQKLYLAGGGVALLTGGLLYVLGRADRKRQERAYVAPSLTKNSGGIVLGGKF